MRHICKMEKLEIRTVIKYDLKKGMPPKEIHKDFMKTLGKESPSYSPVKNEQKRESVKDERRSVRPKNTTTGENVKVLHTLGMCDRRHDLRSIAREVCISVWAVQSILICQRFQQDECREC